MRERAAGAAICCGHAPWDRAPYHRFGADIPVEQTRLPPPARTEASPNGRTTTHAAPADSACRRSTRPRRPTSSPSRIAAAKAALGSRVFILGHHYQRDEVMRWADARGDSFRLSVLAKEHPEAEYIVFCGVHFMAESADVLTGPHQQVMLPDLNAGCSMADMADIDSVEEAWEALDRVVDIETRRARSPT